MSFPGPQSHLVAAFEKSLSNMTCRLQSLTMTAEQKVSFPRRVGGESTTTPFELRSTKNRRGAFHRASWFLCQETELVELRETIESLKTQNTDAQTAIQVALNGPDHFHKGNRDYLAFS